MQEELKRSNTIGDIRGIMHFSKTVLRDNEIKKESAQKICSFVNDVRINYNTSVAFFEYLNFLVVLPGDIISPTAEGRKLYSVMDTDEFDRILCETCIQKMTADSIIDLDAIRFDIGKSSYNILKYAFPVSAALFRNVLIQYNALIENSDGSLKIANQYESFFTSIKKGSNRKKSLESLKKQLEQQELQGERAEIFVLEYEQTRICSSSLAPKIKRISVIDISAGYDIVSFNSALSSKLDRFIEVKSYVGNPHFYWSKNEIEVAQLHEGNYFLYLIDIDRMGDPGYEPTIIQNPFKEILSSDTWLMQPTSFLVIPTDKVF